MHEQPSPNQTEIRSIVIVLYIIINLFYHYRESTYLYERFDYLSLLKICKFRIYHLYNYDT